MVVRGKYLYYGERSCDIRTAISIIYGYQWSRDGVGLYAYLLTYLVLTIATKKMHRDHGICLIDHGSWKVVFA